MVDKEFDTEDLVKKGLKKASKDLNTGLLNEKEYTRRVNFLNNSIDFIQKREGVQSKLD